MAYGQTIRHRMEYGMVMIPYVYPLKDPIKDKNPPSNDDKCTGNDRNYEP